MVVNVVVAMKKEVEWKRRNESIGGLRVDVVVVSSGDAGLRKQLRRASGGYSAAPSATNKYY